jgi:SAM-dependent methyltransferase
MTIENARQSYIEYFTDKIDRFGASPQGVDYNSPVAQETRFEELVKVIRPEEPFSVLDYGCGYGALLDFLLQKSWTFEYHGFDMIDKMIVAAKESHQDTPNAHFSSNTDELQPTDYLLAGAIFNNKFDATVDEWTKMIQETLARLDQLCTKGFSFNMLTNYSDDDRMEGRPDLYFGDPLFFFDFCKRNFSRNVALLHDYGIYDFTILVRKDAG